MSSLLLFRDTKCNGKSWVDLSDRVSPVYIEGVEKFLNVAFAKKDPNASIYCSCRKCVNHYFVERNVAKEHIIVNGFLTKYKIRTMGSFTFLHMFFHNKMNIGQEKVWEMIWLRWYMKLVEFQFYMMIQ